MVNRSKDKAGYAAGFTLIELIISGSIMFLVFVAVYSVFSGGITVWKKANQASGSGHDLRLDMEKLGIQLRNSFRFSSIPFEGREDSIAFAALIDNAVGRLSYFVNEDNILCRRLQNYPEVFKKGESGKYDLLLSGIKELKFSYCYLDNATGDYKWKQDWVKDEQDTIPQAVKIELTFEKNPGEELKFARTIFLPIGTGEQKIELIQ